jgi:hypothetical protein
MLKHFEKATLRDCSSQLKEGYFLFGTFFITLSNHFFPAVATQTT